MSNPRLRNRRLVESFKTNLIRLEPPHRLPGIDLARGFAIFGMFAAHLAVIAPLEWGRGETWSGIVSGRSSILFATLAGVSLALVTAAATSRKNNDDAPTRRWGTRTELALRAILIWVLGITLDGLEVPIFVILPAYAILFLIGIPLLRLPASTLFMLAMLLALTMPFVVMTIDYNVANISDQQEIEDVLRMLGWNYPFLLWTAFIAAGMGAGRVLSAGPHRAWILLVVGAGFAFVGYGIIGPIGNRVIASDSFVNEDAWSDAWIQSVMQDGPHSSGVGEALGSGGFALAVIGVCTLIGATPMRWLLWPIRAAGSMPLTAYVSHIIVWAVWISVESGHDPNLDPWTDFRELAPFWPMTIGVLIGCSSWAALVGKGPMEALLGALTSGRQLRRTRTHPPRPPDSGPGTSSR
ncbi:heparan-alpha-glucosaminide N-acetyltransferase domain-containing protein [Specibacter sp. NPDC078709]|uniref:heparan-alpha-glucosaminide N-acetyltransferase domain-containing protein n=1 Tax=unclassified Specibacter TaxID=3081321 RepID=UPI00341EDC72